MPKQDLHALRPLTSGSPSQPAIQNAVSRLWPSLPSRAQAVQRRSPVRAANMAAIQGTSAPWLHPAAGLTSGEATTGSDTLRRTYPGWKKVSSGESGGKRRRLEEIAEQRLLPGAGGTANKIVETAQRQDEPGTPGSVGWGGLTVAGAMRKKERGGGRELIFFPGSAGLCPLLFFFSSPRKSYRLLSLAGRCFEKKGRRRKGRSKK